MRTLGPIIIIALAVALVVGAVLVIFPQGADASTSYSRNDNYDRNNNDSDDGYNNNNDDHEYNDRENDDNVREDHDDDDDQDGIGWVKPLAVIAVLVLGMMSFNKFPLLKNDADAE